MSGPHGAERGKMRREARAWSAIGSIVKFADNAGGFDLRGCPDPEGTARRIVACVNACAGISVESLEAWPDPPAGYLGAPHGTWAQQLFQAGEEIARLRGNDPGRHDFVSELPPDAGSGPRRSARPAQ